MKSTKAIRAAKLGYIIMSIVMSFLGICLIVHPDLSASVICRLVGCVMVVWGIVKLVGYFSKDLYRLAFQYDLSLGLLLLAVGLVMVSHPLGFTSVLFSVIGVLVLADGLFKVQIALDTKRFGIGKWGLIGVLAVLTGIFGLLLIINPFKGVNIIMILAGISLLLEGIANLFVAIYTVKVARDCRGDEIETTYFFKEDK
jgi:uncharacterized membrane protein HdeD (DUF308 family)